MSINDATNRIRLFTVDGPIPVTGGGGGTEYTEGAAHVPPSLGAAVMGVVDTSSPSLTNQTYTTLRFDAAGNLRTTGSGPGTVDVIQLGGNPINTGAGNTASGTQRVVISSDQAVIPVSVASFPALQNVNLTQVAGNTVQQGSVASTTLGVQAVAVASDQLPAAVTLGEALANTVPQTIVGSAGMVWNGATWSRSAAGSGATTTGTARVTLTTDQVKARDSAAGATDQGIMALSVRRDVAGSLVDADGDYTPLQVTSTGSLRVAVASGPTGTEYVSGDAVGVTTQGPASVAIRKDANGPLTGVADGDYSALQVDSAGRLKAGTEYVTATIPSAAVQGGAVVAPAANDAAATVGTAYTLHLAPATGRLAVDALVSSSATDFASGSAAANPPTSAGPQVVAVYKAGADGLFSNVVNGDFTALQVDSGGRLKTGTEYVAGAVPASPQGPAVMTLNTGSGATAGLRADSTTLRLETRDVATFQWNQGVSNGSDYGMAPSAIRNDYPSALASANIQYAPLQSDRLGSLRTADPRLHIDPYGRQTIGSPLVTGDYRFQHDPFPNQDPQWGAEFWSRYNTVTWDSDRMWVVVGSSGWLQTKAAHPYYSGKAQRVEFCVHNMVNSGSRCGYFHQTKISSTPDPGGSMDGMWLDTFEGNVRFRIQRNGDNIYDVEQNSWNVDTLTGSADPNTNPSGIQIDFNRQIVVTFEFLYAEAIVYLYISQNVPGAPLTSGPRYLANIAKVTTEVTEFLMMNCPNQPVTFVSQNGELRVFWAQVSSLGVSPTEMPGIPRNVSNVAPVQGLSSGRLWTLCGIKLGDSTVQHPMRTNCLYPSYLSISAQPSNNDPALTSPFTWWLIINPLRDGTTDTPFEASQGAGWVSGNTPLGTATYQTYTQLSPERCNFTADSILYTGTGYSAVTQQWVVPPLRRIGTGVDTSQNTSAYWDELWLVVQPTFGSASLDFVASMTLTEIF